MKKIKFLKSHEFITFNFQMIEINNTDLFSFPYTMNTDSLIRELLYELEKRGFPVTYNLNTYTKKERPKGTVANFVYKDDSINMYGKETQNLGVILHEQVHACLKATGLDKEQAFDHDEIFWDNYEVITDIVKEIIQSDKFNAISNYTVKE